MTKFKINDIAYIVRGGIVVKCRIDEIVEHHTQSKEIVKYIVHAYGIKEYLTLDEDDLVIKLEEAIKKAEKNIEDVYVNSMANLKNCTDEVFDKKEQELINE